MVTSTCHWDQAQYPSSGHLSPASASMLGNEAKSKTGFWFNVLKWPVQKYDVVSLEEKYHFNTRIESVSVVES